MPGKLKGRAPPGKVGRRWGPWMMPMALAFATVVAAFGAWYVMGTRESGNIRTTVPGPYYRAADSVDDSTELVTAPTPHGVT